MAHGCMTLPYRKLTMSSCVGYVRI